MIAIGKTNKHASKILLSNQVQHVWRNSLGGGWSSWGLTKQGCFGRDYRDILASCLRRTIRLPGNP